MHTAKEEEGTARERGEEEEKIMKKEKVEGEEKKEKDSLAGGEPVGVVEAAMDGDHEEEAIAQPPEEEEVAVCYELLSAGKTHRHIHAVAVFQYKETTEVEWSWIFGGGVVNTQAGPEYEMCTQVLFWGVRASVLEPQTCCGVCH